MLNATISESETRRTMATLRRAIADQSTVVKALESLPLVANGPAVTLWAQETLRGLNVVLAPIMEQVRQMDAFKGGG